MCHLRGRTLRGTGLAVHQYIKQGRFKFSICCIDLCFFKHNHSVNFGLVFVSGLEENSFEELYGHSCLLQRYLGLYFATT